MVAGLNDDLVKRIKILSEDFKANFSNNQEKKWIDSLVECSDSDAHRLLISMSIDIKHGLLNDLDYQKLFSSCDFTLSSIYPKKVFESLIMKSDSFHLRLNPFSNVSVTDNREYAVIMNFRKLNTLYKSNNIDADIIDKNPAEFANFIKEERLHGNDFGYTPSDILFSGWGDYKNNYPVFILLWEEVEQLITDVCVNKNISINDSNISKEEKINLINYERIDERINTTIINKLLDKIGYIRKREINQEENVFFCVKYCLNSEISQPTSTCGDLWREGKGAYISYPQLDRFGRTYNLVDRIGANNNVKERMHKPFKVDELVLSIEYLGEITDNVNPTTETYDYELINEALNRYGI